MLTEYKNDTFLAAYKKLPLNVRINTKYQDYRAFAWGIKTDYNDSYLVWLLPKCDQNLSDNVYL